MRQLSRGHFGTPPVRLFLLLLFPLVFLTSGWHPFQPCQKVQKRGVSRSTCCTNHHHSFNHTKIEEMERWWLASCLLLFFFAGEGATNCSSLVTCSSCVTTNPVDGSPERCYWCCTLEGTEGSDYCYGGLENRTCTGHNCDDPCPGSDLRTI